MKLHNGDRILWERHAHRIIATTSVAYTIRWQNSDFFYEIDVIDRLIDEGSVEILSLAEDKKYL